MEQGTGGEEQRISTSLAKPPKCPLFHARSEFCNYAVGPWVSVAGRETTLARGNPALKGI